MKKEIEQIFTSAKSIKLSDSEKHKMLQAILDIKTVGVAEETVRNIPSSRLYESGRVSPFTGFYSRLSPMRMRIMASCTAILVLLGTTGTYAQMSLPGELLYPMKINVNEKLRYIAARTPQAKAVLEATFASRRLEEAAELLYTNKLTVSASEQLALGFSTYSDKLVRHLEDLRESGYAGDADKIDSLFTASLTTHREVLHVLAASSSIKGKLLRGIAPAHTEASSSVKFEARLEGNSTTTGNETAPFIPLPSIHGATNTASTSSLIPTPSNATSTVEVHQSTTTHEEGVTSDIHVKKVVPIAVPGNTPILPPLP